MSPNASSVFKLEGQSKAFLTALGHGAEHWIGATFFILLPYLRQDLGLSYLEVGLFVTVINISATVVNFSGAAAVDLTGRRVLFLIASLVSGGIALLVFGLTENYIVLCAMAALIGASNHLWHPAALAFLSEQFPKNKGYVLSLHALGANAGDAIAPVLAGAMIATLSWHHAAMIATVPVLFVAIAIVLFLLPQEKPHPDGRPRGQSWSDYVNGFKNLVQDKLVIGIAGIAGFRQIAQTSLVMFVPLYLAEILKVNPFLVGAGTAALQIGGFVAAPIAGTVSDRIGRRPVIMAGLTGTTIFVIALTFMENTTFFIACIAAVGFSIYATRPVLQGWLMDITPPAMGASATGVMFGTQSILSTITPLIAGAIADIYGLIYVFYFIAVAILISNLIAATLPKDTPAPDPGV